MSEGSLVVWNGPLGSAHHSQVVVPVRVEAGQQTVLLTELSAHYRGVVSRWVVQEKIRVLFWISCLENYDCILIIYYNL